MFTLSRFGVPQEAAKKGFLNKEVAKISEKGSSSYQGVRVFRKLRSVRTYPGSSSTFLEIALVAAIPRCESLAQQSGLRAPDNSSECSTELLKNVIPDLEEDQMAVSFEESEDW